MGESRGLLSFSSKFGNRSFTDRALDSEEQLGISQF
jgi:hypothetical protein